ncbi:hypothetical protein GCM10023148_04520 [Actinokineospora soli]
MGRNRRVTARGIRRNDLDAALLAQAIIQLARELKKKELRQQQLGESVQESTPEKRP